MRTIKPLLAAVALAALSLPGVAQTNVPADEQSGVAEQTPEARTDLEAPAFLSRRPAGQWLSSDYIGGQVYDANGEEIGEVGELVIDRHGRIVALVVGTAGFLAIGEKDIAIPITAIDLVQRGSTLRVVARYTRAELDRAPAFTKDPG